MELAEKNVVSLTVEDRLKKLFSEGYGIDIDMMEKRNSEVKSENLLGVAFQFRARDLLYLYFDIEREFSIKIPEEDIASGKFSSFDDISEIIKNQSEKYDERSFGDR